MATIIFKYFPASARHGPAAACLRQLAAHPHCPVQKTRLAEILAARHVWLEAGALPITRLTPSHAAAVANLPRAMRLGLLQRAISEGLSVRELRARVREIRSAGGERRGRPPAQVADLAATRVENAAMLLDEAAELLSSSPVPVVSPRLQRALFDARRHLERMRAPDRLPSTG